MTDHLRHEFVDEAPQQLEDGIIYVSMKYATTLHLCRCGCRNEVVLPIRPTAWRLMFDGKSITLDPSIGNWSFPCRSHYWIRNGMVQWADEWTDEQVEAGRQRTRMERGVVEATQERTQRWWHRLKAVLLRRDEY